MALGWWQCFHDDEEDEDGEGDGTDWYSDTGLGISRFEDIDFLSEDYINLD